MKVLDQNLDYIFVQANSTNDLLEQLQEFQSRGIEVIRGPYFTSIEIDSLISIINKLKNELSKEEIQQTVTYANRTLRVYI